MDTVDLPFLRASTTAARSIVGGAATALGAVGSRLDDAVIVAHELVSNALDHGAPSAADALTLSWRVEDGLLCIAVRDDGTTGVVAVRPLDPGSARGRGLALVEAVSVRWVVERDPGTLVSAWVRFAD